MTLWINLLGSLVGTVKGGKPTDANYKTDLSVNIVSYYCTVWISMILGGIFLIEQYFGRRIHCFNAEEFKQPPAAIGEYCWERGTFSRYNNDTQEILPLGEESWLLQSYIYFLVRAFFFLLPHLMWNLKYSQQIVAIIKGTEGLLIELEHLWENYAKISDKAYREMELLERHKSGDETDVQLIDDEVQKTKKAALAMTRDVVQITEKQIPLYTSITKFVFFRAIYETLLLLVIVAIDINFCRTAYKYDTTSFFCQLPNQETIRCMVPMMQFLWQGSILSVILTTSCFLMVAFNTLRLLLMLIIRSTTRCFLEHIPFSDHYTDDLWKKGSHRRTYKVVSKFLLQNTQILHPLNFLEAYVRHMDVQFKGPNHVEMASFGHDSSDLRKRPLLSTDPV